MPRQARQQLCPTLSSLGGHGAVLCVVFGRLPTCIHHCERQVSINFGSCRAAQTAVTNMSKSLCHKAGLQF